MLNQIAKALGGKDALDIAPAPQTQHLQCVRCLQVNCVRLRLRQCNHVCCVACLLEHLTFWIRDKAKARIKCIKLTCSQRIHENDINAVLDEEEDGLNLFMPLDHRQWLQYYHNKDVIYYALGGNKYVKQCPLCKSMYVEKEGCSYVTCANLRCRTRFCWQCGDPIESIMHFTGEKCRVGYDDVERGLFWVKLGIDVRAFALVLYAPVFLLACVMTTVALASLPVTLFLSFGSVATGILIFAAYIAFTALKVTPYAKMLEEGYDMFLPMAKKTGLGPFKQMLKDAKEAKKRRKQLLMEQKEMEASERAEIVEGNPNDKETKDSGSSGTK